MFEISQVAGFSLYVSETNVSSTKEIKCSDLCYKDGPQLPALIMTKTCMVHGRYVIVYNERFGNVIYPVGYKNDTVYLRVCEVTVRGYKYIVLKLRKYQKKSRERTFNSNKMNQNRC